MTPNEARASAPLKGSQSATQSSYGFGNPHPLSTLRSELVWEGKYDEFGNRRPINVGDSRAPLQRIETIDEPRARTEAQGGLFDSQRAHLDDFRNLLIWGDNKLVMASLLQDFSGKFDLIYIDPPFDVGADFTMPLPFGDKNDTVEKDQSILEMVAYRDTWGKGTDSYLQMMYERFVLMRDLLSDRGGLYVHCDYRVGAYLRLILGEIFGPNAFRNEIVWSYGAGGNPKGFFPRKHDQLLFYVKGDGGVFRTDGEIMRVPYDSSTLQTHYRNVVENGRHYRFQRVDGKEYFKYADEGNFV